MGATAGHGEVRPLDVQAEDTGLTKGRNGGVGGAVKHLGRVVVISVGKDTNGAKTAVGGGGDGGQHALWRRRHVQEKDITTAVDLQIQDSLASGFRHSFCGDISDRRNIKNCADRAVFHDHITVPQESFAIENPVRDGGKSDQGHQAHLHGGFCRECGKMQIRIQSWSCLSR